MDKAIKISKDLALPLDIAGQTIGLLGIRGSGKTNTAGVIVEELLDHHQPIVVIDPTDVWWGLRSGYPVFIFGGSHADIPLQETDGKTIAEFVVTEQVPLILSLRHLRKGAQRRFVTEFCEELYHLKGKPEFRTPLTVIIDEAPLYVPQRTMAETARVVGAVEDLIARGRASGFGVVLVSQRSQTINKDVLYQADTIITHRLTGPGDRKVLAEWMEEHADVDKEVLATLPKMQNGQAWVWAPQLGLMKQVQIRKRHTFDSSATPKVGERLAPPKKLTEVDIDKLKGKMSAAVEKARADDPSVLRKRIAELEQDSLAAGAYNTADLDAELEKGRLIGFEQGYEQAASETSQSYLKASGMLEGALEVLRGFDPDKKQQSAPPPAVKRGPPPAPRPAAKQPDKFAKFRNPPSSDGKLLKAERLALTALAQYPQGRTLVQVAVLTGYAVGGGGFRNAIGALRSKQFIVGDSYQLQITEDGADALGEFEPLPSGPALLQHWYGQLGKAERVTLEVLADAYPKTCAIDDVAAAAGYQSGGGGFRNALGRLRTLELISGKSDALKASDSLF